MSNAYELFPIESIENELIEISSDEPDTLENFIFNKKFLMARPRPNKGGDKNILIRELIDFIRFKDVETKNKQINEDLIRYTNLAVNVLERLNETINTNAGYDLAASISCHLDVVDRLKKILTNLEPEDISSRPRPNNFIIPLNSKMVEQPNGNLLITLSKKAKKTIKDNEPIFLYNNIFMASNKNTNNISNKTVRTILSFKIGLCTLLEECKFYEEIDFSKNSLFHYFTKEDVFVISAILRNRIIDILIKIVNSNSFKSNILTEEDEADFQNYFTGFIKELIKYEKELFTMNNYHCNNLNKKERLLTKNLILPNDSYYEQHLLTNLICLSISEAYKNRTSNIIAIEISNSDLRRFLVSTYFRFKIVDDSLKKSRLSNWFEVNCGLTVVSDEEKRKRISLKGENRRYIMDSFTGVERYYLLESLIKRYLEKTFKFKISGLTAIEHPEFSETASVIYIFLENE